MTRFHRYHMRVRSLAFRRRCFTHCNPNQILCEVEVFLISTFSNLTPRLWAEGWTLNSAGRTEGRSSHPASRSEQKRNAVCKKQPRGSSNGEDLGASASPVNCPSHSNDLKATSFTFRMRMGDFPQRFVRRRGWRISTAVPFTAIASLPTTLESETAESTAYSLFYRCDFLSEVMGSAWLRCFSSVSAPYFTSWTEDLLKSC